METREHALFPSRQYRRTPWAKPCQSGVLLHYRHRGLETLVPLDPVTHRPSLEVAVNRLPRSRIGTIYWISLIRSAQVGMCQIVSACRNTRRHSSVHCAPRNSQGLTISDPTCVRIRTSVPSSARSAVKHSQDSMTGKGMRVCILERRNLCVRVT